MSRNGSNGSERVALVFEETEYTYAQLDALAGGLAAALAERGLGAGDRIALMSSNRPEWVVAVRAIWRLGAAVALFSPAWKQPETEHALAIIKPAGAVGDHPVLANLMPMLHLDDPITPAAGAPAVAPSTAWRSTQGGSPWRSRCATARCSRKWSVTPPSAWT